MCLKKTSEVLILTRTFFLNKKIVKNAGRKASHTQVLFVVGSLAGTEKQLIQEQETFGDLLQINLPGIGTYYLVFRIWPPSAVLCLQGTATLLLSLPGIIGIVICYLVFWV
jgi:hypothetical protein